MKKRPDPKSKEEVSAQDARPCEDQIPQRLIELAEQLERALAVRRRVLKNFH
jgi:hypothetical protein